MLDYERAYFAAHEQEWMKSHCGSFVVVKDENLVGVFSSFDEALTVGAHRFGLQPFLVRQLGSVQEKISIPALTLGILHANS
jgi:hypothetical protein